jgi:8-oxo-dGTP pyrophosphatase MutT (NUDIX family)
MRHARRPASSDSALAREESAGGVVFRRRPALEVIVAEQIDRQTGERTLRLPKGKLETGETAAAAALREVEEETGVRARIVEPLDVIRYRYAHRRRRLTIVKRVHFFLMEHQSGTPTPADREMERVSWCPIEDAVARLTWGTEAEVVRQAARRLREAGT